ncbi:MAG: threonine--tRNA ligase [Limnohabitans sp.]|nr:threonine--tRNA ligase [Limnohabitans sp.]
MTTSENISITFPDKTIRQFRKGITAYEIAKEISDGLAKRVLVGKVNQQLVDLSQPIETNATVHLLHWDDQEGKSTFWHSTAHLLAEAVEKKYPDAKFWVGPPIDNGFYYDIDLNGKTVSEADLLELEKTMHQLAGQNNRYSRKKMSKASAIAYFTDKGDEYKLDLLKGLEDGTITFYTQGNFTDLCRGPHIPHTGFIKAIKLTNVAGAYWKGDEKNKQLTRIYGVSFPNKKELDDYLVFLAEQKKRDHRKLGKELKIFTFDDQVGPGLPLWLPNGTIIIEELEKLAKRVEFEQGYKRVSTPHIAKEELYITSGHLPYYADSMFPPMELDGNKYYLKAMNCPHHHKIFKSQQMTYKDLPYRIAEYGTCYRYEQSGELFGLMRVRSLKMNDAHIYCRKSQFAEEFAKVNELYINYFKIFNIQKYAMRLSLHEPSKLGEKYVNEPELWQETEAMVRNVLIDSKIPFTEVADEAAFYGPKIDVQIQSVIGKEFTLATNQVDFSQGRTFQLNFTNEHNEDEIPLIIHRAPLGTHERFIAFLLEHYAGVLPLWLSPIQLMILPISEKYLPYSQTISRTFLSKSIRTEIDDRNEKIGRKIRDTEMAKVPYMLIVGEKEMNDHTITIRKHGGLDMGNQPVDKFLDFILIEISKYQ